MSASNAVALPMYLTRQRRQWELKASPVTCTISVRLKKLFFCFLAVSVTIGSDRQFARQKRKAKPPTCFVPKTGRLNHMVDNMEKLWTALKLLALISPLPHLRTPLRHLLSADKPNKGRG
ncbi:hypothetical protein K504DRAFT_497323 [Pleomassaria siparia CBS 279.74]|uniref:Uncharacterized protein n=1 Tax=Pleomassaria siparia CBS 279.74 TaxID=1314801 RepID=A0A6G1KRL5_9PLEO|nr:hypothetical protein K504DRAFT_497323 [Pleomassaria siparia CBS 279.74]